MKLEQLNKVVLFLAVADALEIEDFAEVGVVAVTNMDEIRLNKSLRG